MIPGVTVKIINGTRKTTLQREDAQQYSFKGNKTLQLETEI